MNVGIVLITRWWRASIDQAGYCEALAKLGHHPSLFCLGSDFGPADFPVVEATADAMADPAFWRAHHLDAAIVFSWLRGHRLLDALRKAGVRALIRADSDGLGSVRVFPGATWKTSLSGPVGSLASIRQARHWLARYFFRYRSEDAEVLSGIDTAQSVAIESEEAAENLRIMLRYYRRDALAGKIHVVPHSVPDIFLAAPTSSRPRRRTVFCGGRWEDPQKDAPLLAKTIGHLLRKDSRMEFVIAGPGISPAFDSLRSCPRIRLAGVLPKCEMPSLLSECRFLLSSSRWETQPIGALEALCMGASVVAPPLPGFVSLIEEGASGTLARKRSASCLADAALREMELWDSGARSPVEIAGRWRPRVCNDAVVGGLLEAVTAGSIFSEMPP